MFDLKTILLNLAIPAIKLANKEAGKTIEDAQAALADKHLSADEIKLLLNDAIATAKSLWKEGAAVLDDLSINLNVDVPNIEKTLSDIKAMSSTK